MKRAWARLVAFGAHQESATALALVRICVALSMLVLLVPYCLFDVPGFVWVDQQFGGYRNVRGDWRVEGLSELFGGVSPALVQGLLAVDLAAALLLLVGVLGRLPAFIALQASAAIFRLNPDVSGAADILLTDVLFLLWLGNANVTLSIDAYRGTGRVFCPGTMIASWPRRLIVYQLIVMYVTTGLQKCVSVAWTPGGGFTALFEILQSPHWGRFPDLPLAPLFALTVVGSAVTMIWEIGFPLVLVKRARIPFVVVGMGFHLAILVLMEVGIFSLISMAYYPALFFGDEWDAWARRVREGKLRWFKNRRSGSAPSGDASKDASMDPLTDPGAASADRAAPGPAPSGG